MDCSTSVNYGSFSLELFRKAISSRTPITAIVELTRRCCLSCAHCYTNLGVDDSHAAAGELSVAEYERLFEEMAALGTLWLLITGGEPLLRPDFREIYTLARNRGMLITLFTNAALATAEIAEFLAANQPFRVEATIYGRTRETYERVTGVPGSYDRCMAGIRRLKDAGLPLGLKSLVMSLNVHELDAMKEFAEVELECPFRFDAMINARIDGGGQPIAVRLPAETVVELDRCDEGRMREWRRFCEEFVPAFVVDPDRKSLYHCGAGITNYVIDPEGTMRLCVVSPVGFPTRGSGLREVWEGLLKDERFREERRETRCNRCVLKSLCGMCPANAELETGEPLQPVEFLCEVAHLRAAEMGIAVPDHGDCPYCLVGVSAATSAG